MILATGIVYLEKRGGSNIDPCGTPYLGSLLVDDPLRTITVYLQLCM